MSTPELADLLPVARDMSASLSSEDRSRRLVEVVGRALPCDAVALLRLEGDELVPVASLGLSPDVQGRRFRRSDHPRLEIICSAESPTRFPAESQLADPYDGLVAGKPVLGGEVHSCLGCPLRVEGALVGVLTMDALAPGVFDQTSDEFLDHLAALAGAALRTNDLIEALERRAEHSGLVARDLVRGVRERSGATLIGVSPAMRALREEIELYAQSDLPVLVVGETGTGKELVVRMLHAHSRRAEEALIYVNCAALPEAVIESELFGHTKGAFTGAEHGRLGKFRAADGASIFLDEIGELPLHMQPKLLRVLQGGEVQSVGEDQATCVNVRVFAATNRELDEESRRGRFRSDLLHRLDVCRIRVPALREHPEDIAALSGHFVDRLRQQLGTGPIRLTTGALSALRAGDWPGNVRELENVLSRAVLRATQRSTPASSLLLQTEDLDVEAGPHGSVPEPEAPHRPFRSLREEVEEFQRQLITSSVAQHDGNWAAAARALQVERSNLYRLARRLGIK